MENKKFLLNNDFLQNYDSLEDFLNKNNDKELLNNILKRDVFEYKYLASSISIYFLCKETDTDDIEIEQMYLNTLLNILDYNIVLKLSNIIVNSNFSIVVPPFINKLTVEKPPKIKSIKDTYVFKSRKIFWEKENKIIHSYRNDIFLASLIIEKTKLPDTLFKKNKTSIFFYEKIANGKLMSFKEEGKYMVYSIVISYKDAKFNHEYVESLLNKLEKQLLLISEGWNYFIKIDDYNDKIDFLESIIS